ncbi:MAG: DUF3857 and transglutaminase domain-containing protein [Acidobacteriaceae bacterium]
MTSDPAAPDAPAVYLFREEMVDDNLHFHRVYAQIKILTEKGKEEFSDIEIPYEGSNSDIKAVEGRTIHADGTVIPFTGKPYSKELVKSGDVKWMAKVFSMPDVQVGSILEYRWELQYADNWYIPPHFYLQQSVFTHRAHYHFIPLNLATTSKILTTKDAFGKENVASRLLYYPNLPKGVNVRAGMDGYDVVVENVPALTDEEFSPPLDSYAYQLLFYYSQAASGPEFWREEGKVWSKDVDRFANPTDKIRQAVAGIVSPGDSDEQKLRKIYAAMMTLDNTRFSREHSQAENKAEGLRVKTAADIWEQKRGSDDEITRLFIAMARAAGLKAYAMAVTERNKALFNGGWLDWSQLEDEIAIVNVGGKEVFFDPGQRYCEFGKLQWAHTQLSGIRQSDSGPALMNTPGASYQDNQMLQTADLTLSADGTLKGTVRISMGGAEALRWRQEALRTDEQEVKKDFDAIVQARVPDGVEIRTNHIVGLTDSTTALLVVMDVSGSLGTQTGKRVFLPSAFFEAREKPLFSAGKRENPVDMHYPYVTQDKVDLTLAPGLAIESLPKGASIPIPQVAVYKADYSNTGSTYHQERVMAMGNTLFKATEYPELREFFQKTGAQDQEQVMLKRSAEASTAADTGKSE